MNLSISSDSNRGQPVLVRGSLVCWTGLESKEPWFIRYDGLKEPVVFKSLYRVGDDAISFD